MNEVLIAVIIMSCLALFFGFVLAIANRYLHVEEDPRLDVVEELLPGSNCGACGSPGCRAFAERVVSGEAAPSACTVSGPDGIEEIAEFLGIDAGEANKRVARLHCAGLTGLVTESAEYRGITSCRGAAIINQGGRGCTWGCLGLGDCEVVCDFEAITMSSGGLPVVAVDACTACGDCVDVCPLDLFTLESCEHKLLVQCSSPLAGDEACDICQVACDACGRCALDSAPGVIEMVDGLPVIHAPERTTVQATYRCPTGAIQWVEGEQSFGDIFELLRTSEGMKVGNV